MKEQIIWSKSKLPHTTGRNVQQCSQFGKVWQFLTKLLIYLSYDLAISVLGIYPRKMQNLLKKKKRLSYRNVYDNFNYNSQKQKQKNQQQPGNNANVHQQNEETNCGTLIQQNTTQQKKRGKASASHNRMNASQNITVSGRSQTEKYVIIHAILFHLCEILGKATLA